MNSNQEELLAELDQESQFDMESIGMWPDYLGDSLKPRGKPLRGPDFTRAPSSRRVKAKAKARKAKEKAKQQRLGRRDVITTHIPKPEEFKGNVPVVTASHTGTGEATFNAAHEALEDYAQYAR